MSNAKKLLLRTPRFTVWSQHRRSGSCSWVHYYLEKPDAVLIIPHTDHKIALLTVVRPFVGNSIELPGGRIESTETPLIAAKRELAEETSLRSTKWKRLVTSYPLPSVASETVHIFSARLEFLSTQQFSAERFREGINQVLLCDYQTARQHAMSGRMKCSIDAFALLFFLQKMKR